TEFCYQTSGSGGFLRAWQQIGAFHVASIGNGNMGPWASFSALEQQLWKADNIRAGYRFVPDYVAMPSTITPGSPFAVVSRWSNLGVPPAYTPWHITLQLRDRTGKVVWFAVSKLNLQSLLPGARSLTDAFVLGHIAPGRYQVALVV